MIHDIKYDFMGTKNITNDELSIHIQTLSQTHTHGHTEATNSLSQSSILFKHETHLLSQATHSDYILSCIDLGNNCKYPTDQYQKFTK